MTATRTPAAYERDRLERLLRMNGVPQGDILKATRGLTLTCRGLHDFTLTHLDAIDTLHRLGVPESILDGYAR